MEPAPQPILVLLAKKAATPEAEGILPTAVTIKADCGHDAWISPSSITFLANSTTDLKTSCTKCMPTHDVTEVREVPGSEQELDDFVGRPGFGKEIIEAVNSVIALKLAFKEQHDRT